MVFQVVGGVPNFNMLHARHQKLAVNDSRIKSIHYYYTINFMIFKVIICNLNSNWDAQLRGPFWGTVKKEETTANQKKIKSSKFTTIIKGIKVPFHITNNNTCKKLRVAQAMSNGFIYLGEIQSTIKYWDNERQYNSAKEELYISLP